MRALCSVWDKTGIEDLARGLVELGWEIIASGRTATALAEAGVAHRKVEDVTGSPEMLDGRVKTLHPAIHGGILADRSKPGHMADLERQGIEMIDLVVCNLYPFASQPGIEMIDVGGPTMVRAAAKNFAHVGVVVDPADYPSVLAELSEDQTLSGDTRRRLARAAFAHTATYDAQIVSWFDSGGDGGDPDELPPTIHLSLERAAELRYGENPHQGGARYKVSGKSGWWDTARQHGGLAPSYLNIFDAEAAWQLAGELARSSGKIAVVVVKHANPCGVALRADAATAITDAIACDPISAFGGIVACSAPIDADAAAALAEGPQLDVVVAPAYCDGAVETLQARRRNTRIIEGSAPKRPERDLRALDGGFLVQPSDAISDRSKWEVAGGRSVAEEQWPDVELAWIVCARTSSNAIVLAKDGCAVGIGAGQQNRLDSARIAVAKAGDRAAGSVAASDAFFPFRDGVDVLGEAGVSVIVQPGGSVRDAEVTTAAQEQGIAMVHTAERHFKH